MDTLLSALEKLGLTARVHEHSECHEHDTHVEALQSQEGVVAKTVLLKDKKNRVYVVVAHPESSIECKYLSSRLGVGKGGVGDASPALAQELLHTPSSYVITMASIIGCQYPLGVMLDKKLTTEFWIGAAHGKGSIYLDATHVTQLLSDKPITIVDLEANPKIDKNSPPDLKEFSDAIESIPKEIVEAAASEKGAISAPKKTQDKKKSESQVAATPGYPMDVNLLATSLIEEITDTCTADAEAKRRARQNVIMQLNILRNSSYATGFRAGRDL